MELEGSNKHPRAAKVRLVGREQVLGLARITLEGLFCPHCGSVLEVFGSEKLDQYSCVENGHYVLGEEAFKTKKILLEVD